MAYNNFSIFYWLFFSESGLKSYYDQYNYSVLNKASCCRQTGRQFCSIFIITDTFYTFQVCCTRNEFTLIHSSPQLLLILKFSIGILFDSWILFWVMMRSSLTSSDFPFTIMHRKVCLECVALPPICMSLFNTKNQPFDCIKFD